MRVLLKSSIGGFEFYLNRFIQFAISMRCDFYAVRFLCSAISMQCDFYPLPIEISGNLCNFCYLVVCEVYAVQIAIYAILLFGFMREICVYGIYAVQFVPCFGRIAFAILGDFIAKIAHPCF